jgi:hypothetical protein
MRPSVDRTYRTLVAFHPSGRPSGCSMGHPEVRATSTALDATSTGGWETVLTRGTIATSRATMAPMTSSDRAMLATEPLA